MEVEEKINRVKEIIKGKKIAIAFSGGADSTLVSYLAKEVADDPIAIIFNNGIMPKKFQEYAEKRAEEIGIKHELVGKKFIDICAFTKNTPKRCFLCRELMYNEIKQVANEKGYEIIVDGTNITDLLEDRPGILVNYANNICSPLVKAGIESEEVHKYLNDNEIKYSKATTCLATRIKTNEEITTKKINRISYCEDLIKNISKREVVKVREENDNATIEIDDLEPILNKNIINLIANELKAVNYKKITLNISPKESKQELAIYKPCQDEAGKIMFENQLPYEIDIKKTSEKLEELGKVKSSDKMGVAMVEINESNITVFKTGKIVARKVKNQEDAQNILIKVLPKIRRV